MAKSANLYVRIEPELKEQAENILAALGIPVSNAITMFYKQIILHNGLPFDVKLPEPPLSLCSMTKEQLAIELEKGFADIRAGRTIPGDQVFAEIYKKIEDMKVGQITDEEAVLPETEAKHEPEHI